MKRFSQTSTIQRRKSVIQTVTNLKRRQNCLRNERINSNTSKTKDLQSLEFETLTKIEQRRELIFAVSLHPHPQK